LAVNGRHINYANQMLTTYFLLSGCVANIIVPVNLAE